MNKIFWMCAGVLFILCLQAQSQETLTNQSVISLVKAGLERSTILATVNNAAGKYDVSANAIINLKKQGVATEIINAMIAKGSRASAPATVAGRGSNVLEKLDPGIYHAETEGKFTQLEPTIFTAAKVSGGIGMALSYGLAKAKSKAVLSGTNANLKFPAGSNVFYFIFPKSSTGNIGNEGNQNGWISSATSPNEFILIRLTSINTSRSKSREVVTGSVGSFSGFSSGIPDKDKAPFRFEKTSSGVYKIYFEEPLPAGEYAFIHAGGSANTMGSAPAQKAFDFSIQ